MQFQLEEMHQELALVWWHRDLVVTSNVRVVSDDHRYSHCVYVPGSCQD